MTTLDSALLESVEKDYFDDPRVMALVDRFRCAQSEPALDHVAQISANRVIAAIEEWKSLWWKVPPFASKVNRVTREAITVSHNPLFALLLDAQAAKRMPKGCTTPSGCQQHGCHGECLPAPPKLDKGPVVAQISPNITSAIEEWKQLGGEIIRNEPPSAQLPPLPKNLHSLAGNIWCSICEWADAEPGAEASAAAEQINKALEEEMIAYAKQALRLNGVNV